MQDGRFLPSRRFTGQIFQRPECRLGLTKQRGLAKLHLSAMDFFEQQERAQRQTTLLLAYFAAAVAVMVVLGYVVFASITLPFLKPVPHGPRMHNVVVAVFWLLGEALLHPLYYLKWTWDPLLFAGFAAGACLTIALGSAYKIRQLATGGTVVAELLGGRRVAPDSAEPDEQKLRNVVEEMAIASGMPVPKMFLLDNERGINAFAAGHTRSDVAVGVTRGCLKLLTRDELQGVIAHEFSHILNGDTRLNMRLMGVAHGVLWPVIVGRVFVRGENRPAELGESVLDEDASVTRLPFIIAGYVLLAAGSVGLPFVRLIKSAICREREWLADAAAVQFTRYPDGIAGALKKIGGLYKQGRLDTAHAETASHLYFANSSFTARLRRCEKIGACMRARKMSPRFARESEGFLRPPGALADFFTPSDLLGSVLGWLGYRPTHVAAVFGPKAL
jgi:Zn-dependent protease with chaperone function